MIANSKNRYVFFSNKVSNLTHREKNFLLAKINKKGVVNNVGTTAITKGFMLTALIIFP